MFVENLESTERYTKAKSHVCECSVLSLCHLPGCSAHGLSQARMPEWVAMSSSSASSQPRDQSRVSYVSCVWQVDSLQPVPPGKHFIT